VSNQSKADTYNEQKLGNQKTHWSNIAEAGTLFGLQFLRFVHQVFGRWLVTVFLMPTVVYFMLFRGDSRRASQDFLQAHFARYPNYWQKPPGWFDSAKHFYVFAETVVDKLLSWFIDIDVDDFVIEHPERIEELMQDTRGQLIIGSHMGNLEYCRGFMHRYKDKHINILVHDKHSQNYNTIMQQLNPDSRLHVFQVAEFDVPTMLKIKAKIDAGEWVFIAGDRSPLSGVERTVEVDFMGRTAQLPIGPYMLAKGLGCPVKLMFSYCDYLPSSTAAGALPSNTVAGALPLSRPENELSTKEATSAASIIDNKQANRAKKVHFEVVSFADKLTFTRGDKQAQLQAYAQQFADALEAQCAKAPFQWFNFYDFWADTPE